MKKHEVVTDMTVGQLYDAVAGGGKYFIDGDRIKIINGSLISGNAWQRDIAIAVSNGNITRLVEVPWTDQLDGTWENGVWCMCWDDEKESVFEKVIDTIYVTDFETSLTTYQNATPLPEDLADQLEALSKEKTK